MKIQYYRQAVTYCIIVAFAVAKKLTYSNIQTTGSDYEDNIDPLK